MTNKTKLYSQQEVDRLLKRQLKKHFQPHMADDELKVLNIYDRAEHEGLRSPQTKRVLIYGYDGEKKHIVKTTNDGEPIVRIASLPTVIVGNDFNVVVKSEGDEKLDTIKELLSALLEKTTNEVHGTVVARQEGSYNVELQHNTASIGFATVTQTELETESFALEISKEGETTLFKPPIEQKWVLKDLLTSSIGENTIEILSKDQVVVPRVSLATYGGYIANFSGIMAKQKDDPFVVRLTSSATISIMANVYFKK